MQLRAIGGLTLRRAVFGMFFEAGRPLSVPEVVAALAASGVKVGEHLAKPEHMVIADMLAYQVRAGRLRRVRRGIYDVVPGALSRSTRWRCRHWRDRLY